MSQPAEGPHAVERSIDEVHDDDNPLFGSDDPAHYVPGVRKRSQRHRPKRRKRHRLTPILAILVIGVVIAASYFLVRSVTKYFVTPDYAGTGQAFVKIQIQPGDGANDIGSTLVKAGVVRSIRAFANAAKASGQGGSIQPGVYRVRLHSSGKAAMDAILDPANRLISKVTIPEGYTAKQVLADLAKKTGMPLADLTAAANRVDNLGLPDGFAPKSPEGFLFPATYDFDPSMSADAVVQALTGRFGAEYRQLGFAAAAKALKITPYQALIIASMIESEAKFPEDRPKIARVIYNRLAIGRALQIDSTTRYGLVLEGKDPNSATYKETFAYDTRRRTGLPPTPISNPGEPSLKAAVHPAAGNWLYYVVSDAAGHHLFTALGQEFEAAAQKCRANGWC